MKSAYELAMERLKEQQAETALTAEQKQALADIDARAKADVAQHTIMAQQRMAEAQAGGDFTAMAEVQENLQAELQRIEAQAEREKQSVREGAS